MLTQPTANEDLENFRTERLSEIIDVLQAIAKGSIDILDDKYLNKPSHDDLVMWFVIREIHYNLTDKENQSETSMEVALKVLSQEHDERWLIDNYYFRIQGTVAKLFNTEDFSKINIDLTKYNLTTEFERASLYFNLTNAFTTRFKVLQYVKNDQKIIEFANKMPTFNGRKYFEYSDFNYDDFEWIGHKKTEMYNKRHIGGLYSALVAHLNAIGNIKGKKISQKMYWDSIMSKPQYFKFSESEVDLNKLYNSTKKKKR